MMRSLQFMLIGGYAPSGCLSKEFSRSTIPEAPRLGPMSASSWDNRTPALAPPIPNNFNFNLIQASTCQFLIQTCRQILVS